MSGASRNELERAGIWPRARESGYRHRRGTTEGKLDEFVEKCMHGERVVVYTTDFCGWCERAKSLLAARGVQYREVWLPRTPEGLERLAEAAPSARSFPQIVIDGELVGGYTELVARDREVSLASLAGCGEDA